MNEATIHRNMENLGFTAQEIDDAQRAFGDYDREERSDRAYEAARETA